MLITRLKGTAGGSLSMVDGGSNGWFSMVSMGRVWQ